MAKYTILTHACIYKSYDEKEAAECILNHLGNLTGIFFTDLQEPASNQIMERIRSCIEDRNVKSLSKLLAHGYNYVIEAK